MGQPVKLSSPFHMTCACLRCFLAEASFLPEYQKGDLWPNMLRGKCKSTHRDLSILGISSVEEEVERHWKRGGEKATETVRQETDTEREERAVLCAAEAISLFPSQQRPGNDALL